MIAMTTVHRSRRAGNGAGLVAVVERDSTSDAQQQQAFEEEETSSGADLLPDGVALDTELANAYRMHRDFPEHLRFTHGIGWYAWRGTHYELATGDAERLAQEITRRLLRHGRMLYAAASNCAPDKSELLEALGRRYMNFAKRCQNAKSIKNTLEIARTLEAYSCCVDQLNCDPLLFACANGTVDLRSGRLREAEPSDLITRASPVAFDPDATCPLWEAFLRRAFDGNEELIAYIQRVSGYSLTAITSEQCLHVLYGTGENGKSVFLETMRYVVGQYGQSTPVSSLMASDSKSEYRNDIARLVGVRFVTAIESTEGKRIDEALIKQLTGGDQMCARFLRREFFNFTPVAKFFIATNHKPEVRGIDHGIWRRLRLIPFVVRIAPAERDPNLITKLRAEAAGILAWAIRGCLAWERDGLQPPEAVVAASAEWRQSANIVARFVEQCCVTAPHAQVVAADLYAAFQRWLKREGEQAMTQTAFGRRIDELGFCGDRANGSRIRRGIGLRTDDAEEPDRRS
jgi:putative DNA primase/helicase